MVRRQRRVGGRDGVKSPLQPRSSSVHGKIAIWKPCSKAQETRFTQILVFSPWLSLQAAQVRGKMEENHKHSQ